jgi:hypothetical protein
LGFPKFPSQALTVGPKWALAWLGLASLGLAWPGLGLQAKPCTSLGLQEFSSIEYEIFECTVDGIYLEDCVFVDVGKTMFQAGAKYRGCAANRFVWMVLEKI